jgi:hypothetical protein
VTRILCGAIVLMFDEELSEADVREVRRRTVFPVKSSEGTPVGMGAITDAQLSDDRRSLTLSLDFEDLIELEEPA